MNDVPLIKERPVLRVYWDESRGVVQTPTDRGCTYIAISSVALTNTYVELLNDTFSEVGRYTLDYVVQLVPQNELAKELLLQVQAAIEFQKGLSSGSNSRS